MTDQTAGDMPWQTSPIGLTPAAPTRPPRQKRKAKAEAAPKPEKARRIRKEPALADPYTALAKEAKKARKPREPKAEKAVTNTVRVDIKQYASMTCGLDAGVFVKVHGLLAGLAKGARNKVLGELAKVFG